MKTITVSQLRSLLASINRPQPVAFTALCEEKAKAAARAEVGGRILKLTRYRAWVGDYGRMVTNQLHREGMEQLTFTPKPRRWGRHESMALIAHEPKDTPDQTHYYIAVQVRGTNRPLYMVEQAAQHTRAARRRLKAVPKEAIAHLLPPKREEGGNQGTETPIIHRDVDLSHVTMMSIGGEVYRIKHESVLVNPPAQP